MLARLPQAAFDTVERQHVLVMRDDVVGQFSAGVVGSIAGRGPRDGAGRPRRAVVGAADHHGVGARILEDRGGVGRRGDIAIGDDRDRDRLLDPGDRPPVGLALVELAARAAMDGDHLHARLLGAAGKQRRVERRLVPAEPHLHRDRHGDRVDHRVDQRHGVVEVAHQRRAGIAAGHLLGRAAHVDVDDVGALARRDARGLGHVVGLAAGKLHHVDRQARMADTGGAALPALGELAARHHLGNDQSGAVPIGAQAEGLVGDARHRRQEHPVADFDAADIQRLGQPTQIRHAQKPGNLSTCLFSSHIPLGSATGKWIGIAAISGWGWRSPRIARIDLGHGQGRRCSGRAFERRRSPW